MRVLVTGASGMLGGAVAQGLVDQGHQVTVLQRRPARVASQPAVREVLGDVADLDDVAAAATGQQAVVHLAAKVDVVGRWADYRRVNVDGTRNVVSAARSAAVERLVHVSSPSVAHGGAALVGVGAEPADPDRSRGHYARSKAMAEQLALAADSPSLSVVAVRPHLVWGPGDTQLVGRLVDRARAGRLPVLGSGAALIDTTYVDNAAAALLAAVTASVHGEALVVSNGEPLMVGEVLVRLCRAAGVPSPTRHLPAAVGRVAGSVVDAVWSTLGRRDTPPITRFLAEQLTTAHWFDQRRTREALDWTPQVTLDEGFTRLAAWYASSARRC